MCRGRSPSANLLLSTAKASAMLLHVSTDLSKEITANSMFLHDWTLDFTSGSVTSCDERAEAKRRSTFGITRVEKTYHHSAKS